MLFSNILPIVLAMPLASAYMALRFDPLMKRDNSSYAIVDSSFPLSTSAVTTAVATQVTTVNENGQPTTMWTTKTITYYTTVEQMITPTDSTVSTGMDAIAQTQDSTIISVIFTTITLADTTEVEAITTSTGTTAAATATAAKATATPTAATSDGSLSVNAGQILDASAAVKTSGAGVTTTAANAATTAAPTATVTVTVSASNCVPVSYSTFVNKVALVASFTFTNSAGQLFTATTSTDVEQTSTQMVYLTSTITPTITNALSTSTLYLASTATLASTSAFFGNGTSSG